MNLKENKKSYAGGFKGKWKSRNDVIIISKTKKIINK